MKTACTRSACLCVARRQELFHFLLAFYDFVGYNILQYRKTGIVKQNANNRKNTEE